MKEALKTALIVLLCLSLVALTYLTWIVDARLLDTPGFHWLSEISAALGLYTPAPSAELPFDATSPTEAARPVTAVYVRDGARYGITGDDAVLAAVYNSLRGTLGEALGSAETPAPIADAAFREALSADGVYLEYLKPVSLRLLSVWLQVDTAEGFEAQMRRLFLRAEDGRLTFYYVNETDRRAYRAATPLVYHDPGLPADEVLRPCVFAFEQGGDPALSPYTVLYDAPLRPALLAVSRALPDDATRRALLAALSMNPDARDYLAADGARVYVDDPRTCRFSEGLIIYRNPAAGAQPLTTNAQLLGDTRSDTVETARALTEPLAALWGAGVLQLSAYSEAADGAQTVAFCVAVDGLEAALTQPAVSVTLRDGVVAEAVFRPQLFLRQEARVDLPPAALAASLLKKQKPQGFDLRVCYDETGEPGWCG